MPRSQNGFSANNRALMSTKTIPGTDRRITLRRGVTGWILRDFAAWFDDHVESIDAGQLDDWGYASRPIRGSSTTLSNHASGTAIDLNALKHPMGRRNTFSNADEKRIRRQLRIYQGCIRWGGDYTGRPDEMHFEIDQDSAACKRVRAKLKKLGSDMGLIDALKTKVAANQGSGERRSVAWFLSNIEADQDKNQELLREIKADVDAIRKKM